jgi:uncharacterized protein with FMN-binding domain
MKSHEKIFMVVGTVAVMAVSGIIGYSLFAQPDTAVTQQATVSSSQNATTTSNAQPTSTSVSTSTTQSNSSYKDGTYTGQASYSVPHGDTNSIKVTVTVTNGAIVSASATHDYSDHESGMYVDSFDSSLSSVTQGESLASFSTYRIGGASLTTDAFMQVLDSIKSDAQG